MLGSFAEADDAVQEASLRMSRASGDGVDKSAAADEIVSCQCLNMLRSRATRRGDPLDVRVPDPVVESGDAVEPAEQAALADSSGWRCCRAGGARPGGAARVRAARHVRGAVRGARCDRGRTPARRERLASRARAAGPGRKPGWKPDRARQREIVDAWFDGGPRRRLPGSGRAPGSRTPCRAWTPAALRGGGPWVRPRSPGRAFMYRGAGLRARFAVVNGVPGVASTIHGSSDGRRGVHRRGLGRSSRSTPGRSCTWLAGKSRHRAVHQDVGAASPLDAVMGRAQDEDLLRSGTHDPRRSA